MKPLKPKRCRCGCQSWFTPTRPLQVVVDWQHAKALAQSNREKVERRSHKAALMALKPRRDWIKDAQVVFNQYIRARDADKPCVCCDKPLVPGAVGGGFDCGHYRSVGSAPHLRFDDRNAHGQTKRCNRYRSGNVTDYRIGLIKRIGLDAVEALEADQDARKYTIDNLKTIISEYKAKHKALLTN